MKFTEGAFRDWGYQVAKEFYGAEEIDGGPWCRIPAGQAGRGHRHQGRDRRHHAAAGADAPRRVRRHRDAEPERRLSVGRARGAGRRHRHRAGRQHQLRHRPRRLRSDARDGAEIREPGQGESRVGDSFGRDDVPAHGMERGGRPDRQGHGRRDRLQAGDLRLRAADGRRDRTEDLGVRRRRSFSTCRSFRIWQCVAEQRTKTRKHEISLSRRFRRLPISSSIRSVSEERV